MTEPLVKNLDTEDIVTPETEPTYSRDHGKIIHVKWTISPTVDTEDIEIRAIAKRSRNKWMDENPA
jgi:hypothetical protein